MEPERIGSDALRFLGVERFVQPESPRGLQLADQIAAPPLLEPECLILDRFSIRELAGAA